MNVARYVSIKSTHICVFVMSSMILCAQIDITLQRCSLGTVRFFPLISIISGIYFSDSASDDQIHVGSIPMSPVPRYVTSAELQVLESCLRRWRTEVESDVKGG